MKKARAWFGRVGAGRIAVFAAVLLAICLVAFLVLRQIGTITINDVLLLHHQSDGPGWTYSTLGPDGTPAPLQAVYGEYGFLEGFADPPAPGAPVAYSCALAASVPDAELDLALGNAFVVVFLGGEVLYTDFPGEEATLQHWPQGPADIPALYSPYDSRDVNISLPAAYQGQTLTVVEYPAPESEGYVWYPITPSVTNAYSMGTSYLMTYAPSLFAAGAYAVILLILVFLFGWQLFHGQSNWALLLPIIFLLIHLLAFFSFFVSYQPVGAILGLFFLLAVLAAPDLILAFLALKMRCKGRYALLVILAAHVLYVIGALIYWLLVGENPGSYLHPGNAVSGALQMSGFLAAFGLTFWEWRHGNHYFSLLGKVLIIGAVVFPFLPLSLWMDPNIQPGWAELWGLILIFNFAPLLELLSNFLLVTVACLSVADYISGQIRRNTALQALEIKNRLSLESFEAAQEAARVTNMARHDLAHHALMLGTLLDSGQTERARRYLGELAHKNEQLPPARYCANMLLNSILQSRLTLAAREGIRVDWEAQVPAKLLIADSDLCSFFMNLLDNAIEACRRLPENRRWIRLRIQMQEGSLLAASCQNAWDGQLDRGPGGKYLSRKKKDGLPHGYGIAAMQAVAEKYNSLLDIRPEEDAFSVQTCLQVPV